jgi:PAS domain S-box-containing protein
MPRTPPRTRDDTLRRENEELRSRLEIAEETLRAIRAGEVDALVVNTESGDRVFTLQSADHPYRAIVETMQEGAATLTPDGAILYSNTRLAAILGIPLKQLIGSSFLSLLPESEHARFLAFLNPDADGRSHGEFTIGADSKPLHVLIAQSPLLVEGVRARCLVVTDLSELRAIEKAELELKELSENLERLVTERTALAEQRAAQLRKMTLELTRVEQRERRRVAQILHDHVQQLLVGAKFNLIALKNRPRDPESLGEVAEICALLDQAIDASRSLSYDLSPPILHQAGLVPALHWLVADFGKKYQFRVNLESEIEGGVIADPILLFLFQAIRELLFNAAKHAGVDSADLVLRRTEQELEVEITDAGVGFDPAQVESSHGRDTGLGLASIRERAALLGARFAMESRPGQGSRFTLHIPIALCPERPPDESCEAGPERRIASESLPVRVLLVDDHRIVRRGLALLLAQQPDFVVAGEAGTGAEAIEVARRVHPDVVLMDVVMPDTDGVEATRRLRAEFPEVCVIGLSMFREGEMCKQMLDAGASTFLTKSGPPEALLATIRAHKRAVDGGDKPAGRISSPPITSRR